MHAYNAARPTGSGRQAGKVKIPQAGHRHRTIEGTQSWRKGSIQKLQNFFVERGAAWSKL